MEQLACQPDEGPVVQMTQREALRVAELLQLVNYAARNDVPGLSDIEQGYRPPYPQTVYNVSGDDTSGIAGMVLPSGEFIRKAESKSEADYWEFDETLRYEEIIDPVDGTHRVRGNSWTKGEVVWDGHAGEVKPHAAPIGPRRLEDQAPHYRQEDRNAITGDWVTTGELWRAIERGTAMRAGRTVPLTHDAHTTGPRLKKHV